MSETTTAADASTDFDYYTALTQAHGLARYDHVFSQVTQDDDLPTHAYLAPESRARDDELRYALALWASPSSYVIRAAAESYDLDDEDGAKPGQVAPAEPRDARTFDFERDDDADDDHVIRVTDEFDSRYGTKLEVETPAPWDTPDEMTPANEVIKRLDWEATHRTFDSDLKAWTLDADALDALREVVADSEYDFEDARDADPHADADDIARIADFAQAGDHITVRYAKKNGNGEAEYAGEVTDAVTVGDSHYGHANGVAAERDRIAFIDTNGKGKMVKHDDDGIAGLFSRGYHPFMGTVESVTIDPDN